MKGTINLAKIFNNFFSTLRTNNAFRSIFFFFFYPFFPVDRYSKVSLKEPGLGIGT